MGARRKLVPARKKGQSEEEAAVQRRSANQRERQRTKELNDAFTCLRRIIPSMPSDKMSKIHTLKIATEYIRFLDQMNKGECKLFGCELPCEENGLNLQTSFSLWRGGMAQQHASGISSSFHAFQENPYYATASSRILKSDTDGWFLTGKPPTDLEAASSTTTLPTSSTAIGYMMPTPSDYGALLATGLVLDQSLQPSASSTIHHLRL